MKERTYQFTVEDVTITVTKKRMKHMYLRIRKEDGSVLISAPHTMSDARIRAFAAGRIDWIKKYQKQYGENSGREAEASRYSPEEIRERKALLKQKTQALLEKWEPVMGVHAEGITIRQMKTRWGSCNVKTHHINMNLALLSLPDECLEYVVVHELAHILEPSHNQVFWDYMTRFYPDWKRVRRRLNEAGVPRE